MAVSSDTGRRLLPSVIDAHAANDPTKIYASIPFDNSDITSGFRDITYREFANAINCAAWWMKQEVRSSGVPFETIAYAGPKDLRYPIIAVAAGKCGNKLLLTSSYATTEAQTHLLRATDCNVFLHASSHTKQVQSTLMNDPTIKLQAVPELEEWLFANKTSAFPYSKTWEEAYADPWLIFHTSGTTGLPKPVIYTNWMMTSFDAAELMPDADQETTNDHFRDSRCYTPLPSLHFVGMTAALQWTVFLNTVLVFGPPDGPNAGDVSSILSCGKASGAVLTPSIIENQCRSQAGLDILRKLDYIYFAGAALPPSTAQLLVGHCKLQPGMGSTEAGAYFITIRNDDDWDYYQFRPSMGIVFEPKTPDLYELVFRRKPELGRWQQIFHLYPDDETFRTKDLWTKHPSKPDLWRYAAREDDMIVFSHGENLFPSEMESEIMKHPRIKTALIGGQGKSQPFLLLELMNGVCSSGGERELKLADVWTAIVKANERCSEYVRLTRELVLFTSVDRRLPRTSKDTVPRRTAFALYASEIADLYQDQ